MVTITRTFVAMAVAAALALSAIATAPLEAQRRRGDDRPSSVPVTTEMLLSTPEVYAGQLVTLSSGVDQLLSPTAFTVDQRKVTPGSTEILKAGKPLLVIAPTLAATLAPDTYLTIVGEIVKLDASFATKAGAYTLDLAPDAAARYQGQYVLLARTVHSRTFAELTKPTDTK